MNEIRNVIIIGGGPAGYTAALYAARADLNPLVIEGFAFGGQLMITSDVENYPGFKKGILGPELMQEFRAQAERFGAEFLTDDVTRVDFSERPFRVYVGEDEYLAETVIIATGATARQLGVEGEQRLQGREDFRASHIMLDRARANEKIEWITSTVVDEVIGGEKMTGAQLRDVRTEEVSDISADGLFVAIGHDPNTALFLDQLDHDEA